MAAKAGRVAPKTDKGGAPPAPPPQDDRPHLSGDEVKEIHYRKLMAQHREMDAEVDKLESAKKAVTKRRSEVRGQLKRAGFYLSNVDEVRKDSAKDSDRVEMKDRVQQRDWMRKIEGLPVAKTDEQTTLELRLPETERQGIAWEEAGYHAGIIGDACALPAHCPPIFHQRWTNFWHKGKDRRDWAMAQEVNVERPLATTAASRPDLDPEPGDAEGQGDTCATCNGDGTGLDDDVSLCPDCGAEYDPPEAPAADDDASAAFDDDGAAVDQTAPEPEAALDTVH